jgi:hypothetical protein
MSLTVRSYWFEFTAVAVGLATAAALLPHGEEAVFSIGALTAAALSARRLTAPQSLIRA